MKRFEEVMISELSEGDRFQMSQGRGKAMYTYMGYSEAEKGWLIKKDKENERLRKSDFGVVFIRSK